MFGIFQVLQMGEHRDQGIPIQNTQSILENLGKSLEYFKISRKFSKFCKQNVQNLFYTYISKWKHLPFSWCLRMHHVGVEFSHVSWCNSWSVQ